VTDREDDCHDGQPHEWDGKADPDEGYTCMVCGLTEVELGHIFLDR
jgi:hypothetical protein